MDTIASIKGETGRDARRRIRSGGFRKPTSGMAPGYVQGNLAILPKELAADFTRFCMLNPKTCPLLGQSEPGDWRLPTRAEWEEAMKSAGLGGILRARSTSGSSGRLWSSIAIVPYATAQ